MAAGQGQARVRLVTEDGREYAQAGTLQFADVTVDPGTGSIGLRALFPNPKGELLPGMFVRARLEEGVSPQALLVPQVGVTRDQKGLPVVLVVNADRKVERRQLVTDRAIGDAWLVTEGLKAGEQVIVEGLQKVRPGALVNPVPLPGRPAPSSRRQGPVAQFFIDRPIFAWVIGILVMLGGALSIFSLPVSQYPAIAPPTISVNATYPGASARTLEDTVTQVIEQRMNGLDHLRYMASVVRLVGQRPGDAHLRRRHRSGHRPGAGAEQAAAGRAAAAAGGAAAGRAGGQVGLQLPAHHRPASPRTAR